MKFTIITVCYNAQPDIGKTIESVLKQTYTDFQYIIKDGQSTDNTLQIAEEMVGKDTRVIIDSSKDTGIYHAMNQAIQMAEGEYLFFLNAGDYFHDAVTLAKMADQIEETRADVVYGDICFEKKDSTWIKKYRNAYRHKWIYLLGDCICHQAMFAKKELFEEKLFDIKYKICADRDWQLYYLRKKAHFEPLGIVVADVPVDGFSLQNVDVFEKETEECLKEHYSKSVWIYKCFMACKKNSFVRWILNKLQSKSGE